MRDGALSNEPIAIIGMSGRFPEARNVEDMWRILAEGRSAVTEIALERFDWRDDFAWDAGGALLGWTRVREDRPPESFDAEGRRLPDPGNPAAAVAVAYPLSRAKDGRLLVEEVDAAPF